MAIRSILVPKEVKEEFEKALGVIRAFNSSQDVDDWMIEDITERVSMIDPDFKVDSVSKWNIETSVERFVYVEGFKGVFFYEILLTSGFSPRDAEVITQKLKDLKIDAVNTLKGVKLPCGLFIVVAKSRREVMQSRQPVTSESAD